MPKREVNKELLERILSGRGRSQALEMIRNTRQNAQKDNTRVSSGMDYSQSVAADMEKARIAAVVAREKASARAKGKNDFLASSKVDAMNNAKSVYDAYKYTDAYKNGRTLAERILDGKPSYPMYAGSGAIEILSPSPANSYGSLKFIRNIKCLPAVANDGSVSLANNNRIFGNFTTDIPFRLHPDYPHMPGGEIMIVDQAAFKGKTPWSIRPMDTFFRTNELNGVDPKYITIISGDERYLNDAEALGMKTRTNQGLIDEYSKIGDFSGKPLDDVLDYRRLIDKELSDIGRPTKADYEKLENATGLKSYTSSDVKSGVDDLMSAMKDIDDNLGRIGGSGKRPFMRFVEYPEGDASDYYTFNNSKDYIRKQLPFYKNVYYNPIPTIEYELLSSIGLGDTRDYIPFYEYDLNDLFNRKIRSNPIKSSGGKIHIKPENRGKFTALKKRTGHSASWFKAHGTPAQKKMAVFALNARKWSHKHDLGGSLSDSILYDYLQEQGNPMGDILLVQPEKPAQPVKISGDAPEPVYMPMAEPMPQPIQQQKTFTPTEVTDRLKRVAASAAALSHLKKTLPVDYIRNYRNTMNTDTPAEYTPSEDLIQYLISTENFLERPDNSLDGKWTIGYGDTDKKLNDYYLKNKDKKYTRAEAEKRLRDRVANEFLPELKKSVPNWDRLTPAQKDSLLSYAYNAGKYFVSTHKNFASAMRDFDLARAASELNAGWNQKDKKGRIMTGIRKRRLQEQYAFTHPDTVRFGQAKADGGLLDRLDRAYEGDAQAMLEAVRKAKNSKL